jgi:hypothetical protein
MRHYTEYVPGPTPDGDTILPFDPKIVEKCVAVFADDAREFSWQFGPSVLSKSERWGTVWRADVISPRNYPARVVVWSPDSGGQGYGEGHFALVEAPLTKRA